MGTDCVSGNEAPASSLDGQRSDKAGSGLQEKDRPVACPGGGREGVVRREAKPHGFQVRLPLRPRTQECSWIVSEIRQCPDVFDIHTDVRVERDRDEGQVGGMREIEPESAAEGRAHTQLTEFAANEPELLRSDAETGSQESPQSAVRDDEPPPVPLKAKARAPLPFVFRERREEVAVRNVQADAPAVDFVHDTASETRTGSASATTSSRGPSNGSRPCAVRILSTRSRSPACQDSRKVLASYTSLITRTTSASMGSPLPNRVLNGSPSSP